MRSAVSSAPTLNNRFAHAAARAELNPVLPASQPQEEATTQSAPVETIHATVPAAQATTAAPVLVAGGGVLREVHSIKLNRIPLMRGTSIGQSE